MKYGKALIAASLCVIFLQLIVTAQTPKSRPKPRTTTTPAKPAAAKPTPTPVVKTAPAAPAPPAGTLAVVNGQPIMLADLEPTARAAVEGFDKEIEEMRRTALEEQVGTYLLEAEAKKRKLTLQQLMDAEINSHVAQPSEAEIQAFFEANRARMAGADYNTARPQIAEYLRQQSVQSLVGDYVNRLRLTTQVKMGADPNAPNLTPTTVLATVGGRTITRGPFEERMRSFIYKRRMEIYGSEMDALNFKIYELLLAAEAQRRNSTPKEIVRTEVAAKVQSPTDADVAKFYEDNKTRIQGDLASLREQIYNFLLQQEQRKLLLELNQRLRAAASVQVLLTEPEPPVLAVSTDDDPSRGAATAPVTMVEFTDFQCPSCALAHPIIDELLSAYGNRLRLVVRDFPLPNHANSRKAAEAANAAAAQGKFFEYIAILFKNQSALDTPSLKRYAADLGLNTARFNAALDSGEYAAEVEHDLEDGAQYGVDATPAIFINGVRARDVTAEGLRAAIERALARSTQATSARPVK